MAKIEPYTSDLTDMEWEIVRRLLPVKGKLGRPPRYERRLMLNAIFYITRTGCPWRDLPHDFPKWRLVYYYFSQWQRQGVWEQINTALPQALGLRSLAEHRRHELLPVGEFTGHLFPHFSRARGCKITGS